MGGKFGYWRMEVKNTIRNKTRTHLWQDFDPNPLPPSGGTNAIRGKGVCTITIAKC